MVVCGEVDEGIDNDIDWSKVKGEVIRGRRMYDHGALGVEIRYDVGEEETTWSVQGRRVVRNEESMTLSSQGLSRALFYNIQAATSIRCITSNEYGWMDG